MLVILPSPISKLQHTLLPSKCCEPRNVFRLLALPLFSLQTHIWICQGAWECVTCGVWRSTYSKYCAPKVVFGGPKHLTFGFRGKGRIGAKFANQNEEEEFVAKTRCVITRRTYGCGRKSESSTSNKWNKQPTTRWIKISHPFNIEELKFGPVVVAPLIFHIGEADIGKIVIGSHIESLEKNLNHKPF